MLGFLLALAVVSVHAQSRAEIAATIPFDFAVGDVKLPAGKYTARPRSAVLLIQSKDAKSAVMRLTNRIETNGASEETRLVFHRYGELYFLSELWMAGDESGRQLLKSRQERAFDRRRPHPSKKEEAQASYDRVEIVGALQ